MKFRNGIASSLALIPVGVCPAELGFRADLRHPTACNRDAFLLPSGKRRYITVINPRVGVPKEGLTQLLPRHVLSSILPEKIHERYALSVGPANTRR